MLRQLFVILGLIYSLLSAECGRSISLDNIDAYSISSLPDRVFQEITFNFNDTYILDDVKEAPHLRSNSFRSADCMSGGSLCTPAQVTGLNPPTSTIATPAPVFLGSITLSGSSAPNEKDVGLQVKDGSGTNKMECETRKKSRLSVSHLDSPTDSDTEKALEDLPRQLNFDEVVEDDEENPQPDFKRADGAGQERNPSSADEVILESDLNESTASDSAEQDEDMSENIGSDSLEADSFCTHAQVTGLNPPTSTVVTPATVSPDKTLGFRLDSRYITNNRICRKRNRGAPLFLGSPTDSDTEKALEDLRRQLNFDEVVEDDEENLQPDFKRADGVGKGHNSSSAAEAISESDLQGMEADSDFSDELENTVVRVPISPRDSECKHLKSMGLKLEIAYIKENIQALHAALRAAAEGSSEFYFSLFRLHIAYADKYRIELQSSPSTECENKIKESELAAKKALVDFQYKASLKFVAADSWGGHMALYRKYYSYHLLFPDQNYLSLSEEARQRAQEIDDRGSLNDDDDLDESIVVRGQEDEEGVDDENVDPNSQQHDPLVTPVKSCGAASEESSPPPTPTDIYNKISAEMFSFGGSQSPVNFGERTQLTPASLSGKDSERGLLRSAFQPLNPTRYNKIKSPVRTR